MSLITQYPFPVPTRGAVRPSGLRSMHMTDWRMPDLGYAPRVGLVTGFGAGGCAGLASQGSEADQSQGLVKIRCGLNPGASGTIQLDFSPLSPQTGEYWGAADWATLAVATGGSLVQLTWTATRPLISNETLVIAYQWAFSQ